ncbi:MAG: hypothetical protein AVDCRST_MAG96-3940, partial [uncultured Segetibacter sp.]
VGRLPHGCLVRGLGLTLQHLNPAASIKASHGGFEIFLFFNFL